MCSPEPKDPQDAVVAKQYMSNPGLFKTDGRQPGLLTKSIRKGTKKIPTITLEKLETGVTEDEAISVLSCNNWDLAKATDYIFS
ncbi:hypothetical protein OSTOST_08872 [Ostertagia ostertagi]